MYQYIIILAIFMASCHISMEDRFSFKEEFIKTKCGEEEKVEMHFGPSPDAQQEEVPIVEENNPTTEPPPKSWWSFD